ncbi:Uncharacterized protein APZ42_007294 [Daphnia magna]|uniref:Uncharacterized protein n=1 Tax=Daphnia magna TaxID=35525 RepID=A0A164FDI5_9CRUS|nr:Uncharacterized protein APZ42_007294 [Daphnia magna]
MTQTTGFLPLNDFLRSIMTRIGELTAMNPVSNKISPHVRFHWLIIFLLGVYLHQGFN